MTLFIHEYRLKVDTLLITGLHIAGEVAKHLKRTPNTCELSVSNLSRAHREQLEALSSHKAKGKGKIQTSLEVGYPGQLELIFRGDLRHAASTKDGGTWTTKIEGDDGGRSVLSARVNQAFPPGATVAQVAIACAKAMGVGVGNLPDVASQLRTRAGVTYPNGTAISGQAPEELQGILASCGYTYSIQNGVIQVLKAGKALRGQAVLLTESTGLVSTPTVSPKGIVSAIGLIQPGLYPGAMVKIRSSTATGQYKIIQTKYALPDWYAHLECKVAA